MPTYEYHCPDCAHRFERFQSITAKAVRVCPACGRRRVKRLIGTGGGLIFKGSGFYATDYRSEAYTKEAKAEGQAADAAKSAGASDTARDKSAPAGSGKAAE